ncbi:MAG: DUF3592 domain-containing protein [Limisphaerales bacterium]
MRKSGLIYPLLLLTCWTGLIVAGTFALIETTVRQQLALRFATTQCRIVQSQMGHGEMSRRGIEIEYNYTVNRVDYTGHRYRYDDHNATLEWGATVVEHPRWSIQTVYYDPKNPAEAVLEPGIDGCDLLLLMFALPLNVVTCLLWSAIITRLREKFRVRPAGGVRILRQPGQTCVSLAETPAIAAGFYGSAAAAFIAAFPVVIACGFEPRLRVMEAVWGAVLAAGVVVSLWWAFRNRAGVYDLRIDQTAQTVTLPQTAGRRKPLTLARREISGVSMQRRQNKGPSGTRFTYLPSLKRGESGTTSQPIELISLGWSEEKAQAFSQWLSQELGVEFKGVEEEQVGVRN